MRNEKSMEMFRETLEDCCLVDVGFSSPWFTWERGNLSKTNIREQLYRGVINVSWLDNFPNMVVLHLPNSFSNHYPL